MGRTIAIGDIHGCAFALDTLLEAIQPTHADQIICLGDMIDFGRETREVIDCLIDLSDSCQLIGILGNHEEMLLNALENPRLVETWLNLGGWDTVNSYRYAGSLDDIPLEHIVFIQGFRDYFETSHSIFTHANYAPQQPLSETPAHTLRWSLLEQPYPGPHQSGKKVFVGHTEQSSGEVLDLGHVCCIDTTCHGYGWLTAIDVGTGEIWQASRWGALRDGEALDGLQQARATLRIH